jgi:hypothetical protein
VSQSINNRVPIRYEMPKRDSLFFMVKNGVNELYEGVVNKLYEAATVNVDPASAFGEYGCAVVHRLNDAGEIEIVHVEYLEPIK